MRFTAEIRDGKTLWYDRQRVSEFIRSLEGQQVTVTVEKRQELHSARQRGYYRRVILPTLERDGPGYTAEEWHEILKHMFLLTEKDGRVFARSTGTLSKLEYSNYIDKILRWSAIELGVVIEDPRARRETRVCEPSNHRPAILTRGEAVHSEDS